jgi:selenophosphate synthetase-related protein
MAGLVGSIAMLLEPNALGVALDLERLPTPAATPLGDWLSCFPCLVFLVVTEPDRVRDCVEGFAARGLVAEQVGTIDPTGLVRLRRRDEVVTVFDLGREPVTGLNRA